MIPSGNRWGAVVCSICSLLFFGCEPKSLDWSIRFEPASLGDDAVRIEATIRRGGCAGEVVFMTELSPRGSEMGMAPSRLAKGTYGFSARAFSARCEWFAEGCTEVALPDERVQVVLMSSSPLAECSPARCQGGVCVEGDGGFPDLPPPDGGDGGCGECGECGSCSGGSCLPLADGVGCGGGCARTCVAGMCTGGAAADGALCPSGTCRAGGCCTGCWNGTTCENISSDGSCGTGGAACLPCGECQRCMDGACMTAITDALPCPRSLGLCYGGLCCTGCWDSMDCRPGATRMVCGTGGNDCQMCDVGQFCNAGFCAPVSI